ncbi:ABC transporter, ATPase subunit [Caballeronia hypogeia]|uniref:ABC transporter, ATPase subunit n=1 Tax=Caballeronia hypogeia TaxID=1777140 RepID=A0A158DR90_9BURK|nr:ABC transporter ATP-binding protein [Caballeronia hypogeia]SAK97142.1 ABC transporter, ATPase subunit [Caballeronia hypogeia]
MSELRVQGLRKAFDEHPVLHGVDLTVPRGALFALLGPSGSGKTTLLRLLCGFERADAGTIDIDGRRVEGPGAFLPSELRRIGYVPQEGALFPHLSVAENIVFGLPRSQRKSQYRVAELLELVGLPLDYARRAPQQLSGGQQQRVALARALAPSPGMILLDEPFSSLDAALRIETRKAVARALADTGTTAILVTHDQAEALSLGDQVAVLLRGTLVQTGSARDIYLRPATRELAEFVGDAVLLSGFASGGFVNCALGRLRLMGPVENGAVDVMIRPEQIRLVPALPPGSSDAHVTDVVFNGRDALVTLRLTHAQACNVIAYVPGHCAPRIDENVGLSIEGGVIAYAAPEGASQHLRIVHS